MNKLVLEVCLAQWRLHNHKRCKYKIEDWVQSTDAPKELRQLPNMQTWVNWIFLIEFENMMLSYVCHNDRTCNIITVESGGFSLKDIASDPPYKTQMRWMSVRNNVAPTDTILQTKRQSQYTDIIYTDLNDRQTAVRMSMFKTPLPLGYQAFQNRFLVHCKEN